jgi:cytochrome P450
MALHGKDAATPRSEERFSRSLDIGFPGRRVGDSANEGERGIVTTATKSELVYDPYDRETIRDPYAVFKRLRDEAPLYHNEEHGFYAVSRFADVEKILLTRDVFISEKGVTLDLLKAGYPIPSGTLIFDEEPAHGIHRRLLSRMFTPRRIGSLEDSIRSLCQRLLEPLVGSGGFDFVVDLGSQVPMRVIGMLLGIPEADQEGIRDHFMSHRDDDQVATTFVDNHNLSGEIFSDYIDWRVDHPSDDIMTVLLQATVEDADGETKRLSREELLAYVNIIAAAGNETTRILIGNTGKILSDFPTERRKLVDDPSLVSNAIEEILRYEPNTLQNCRYVSTDFELHGEVIPAGSFMVTLTPAANRDERHFEDPDRFVVQRRIDHHLTFGFGSHYCLGQALARLEGRIALEEVLKLFPEWEAHPDQGVFMYHPDMRGYSSLPITVS